MKYTETELWKIFCLLKVIDFLLSKQITALQMLTYSYMPWAWMLLKSPFLYKQTFSNKKKKKKKHKPFIYCNLNKKRSFYEIIMNDTHLFIEQILKNI